MALAHLGDHLAAALGRFARIGGLEQRRVAGIEGAERVEIAFLHPVIEVGRRDAVRET